MKTFKKALSIVLSLVMMLSCVAGMQISASAEGANLELAVGTATVDGTTVTVPINVVTNPGFRTLSVTVDYNEEVLQLTAAEKNAEFATVEAPGNDVPNEVGEISEDNKTIMWAYVTDENITATGKIADFIFSVVEGASVESTEVSVTINEVTKYDADAEYGYTDIIADATTTPGTVTFACKHDINTDDNVNFVEFTAEGIVHYEDCTLCDEKVVTSTDTSADAVTVAEKALDQAYVSAINVTAAGTYDIPVTQNTGLQVAYVKGDKIYANAYHPNHNNDDISDGENAVNLAGTAPYANGSLTGITDTVNVTVDFTGIVMAFVPADVSKLPTSTISMASTLDLGSSIALIFKVDRQEAEYFESVYALIDHDAYDGNTPAPVVDSVMSEYTEETNRFVFTYNIMASQMGDSVTCDFYGTLDGIEYSLRQKYNFSVVAYAISANGYGGSDAGAKTLISTMLRYGATAQKAFLYRTSELVTENSAIVAGDYLTLYPAAAIVEKADIEYVESSTAYYNEDGTTPAIAERLCAVGKGLNCESTVEIYYNMKLSKFISAKPDVDLNDIKFTVYYKEPSQTVVDMPFSTKEFTIADAYKVENGTDYFFKADKIVASMMGSESKIVAQIGDYIFCESFFSVNAYNHTNYDSATPMKTGALATQGELCKEIVTYGAVAREYFKVVSK